MAESSNLMPSSGTRNANGSIFLHNANHAMLYNQPTFFQTTSPSSQSQEYTFNLPVPEKAPDAALFSQCLQFQTGLAAAQQVKNETNNEMKAKKEKRAPRPSGLKNTKRVRTLHQSESSQNVVSLDFTVGERDQIKKPMDENEIEPSTAASGEWNQDEMLLLLENRQD
jgi:hypothetical protein